MAGGFAKTIAETYAKLIKRFTRSAEEAVRDQTGPNQDAVDAAQRELERGAAEARSDSLKGAYDSVRNRMVKGSGLNRLERWFVNLMHKAFDAVGRLGKWLSKKLTAGKVALTAGAVAGIAAVAASLQYAAPPRDPPPASDPVAANGSFTLDSGYVVDIDIPPPIPNIPPPDIDFAPMGTDIAMDEGEFGALLGALGIPSLEAMGRERVDLNTADLPPPVEFPAPLRAIAAAPVQVEVTRDGQVTGGTTTVQQIYEAVPQVREELVEQATQQHADRGGIQFRDIRVTSEVGSITIKMP